MGLAKRMWPQHVEEANLASMIAAFGISHDAASRAFTGSYYRAGSAGFDPVQPEQVADVLDAIA
jgi:hypothetical protein